MRDAEPVSLLPLDTHYSSPPACLCVVGVWGQGLARGEGQGTAGEVVGGGTRLGLKKQACSSYNKVGKFVLIKA